MLVHHIPDFRERCMITGKLRGPQPRNRRNLTDADIARLVAVLDQRKQRGGDHGNQHTGGKVAKAPSGAPPELKKTGVSTAQTIGVSPRKVEQTRTVIDQADQETKEQVLLASCP